MIDNEWLGQKSKQGFYKKIDKGVIHSIDLDTLEYTAQNQKQIRIEGKVFKIEKHRSEEYFQSRPTESKIGAWASSQSKLLKNRSELIKKFKEKNKKFLNKVIDRPVYWSGYIVVPKLIEFWNQKPHRLHDRVEYRKKRIGWVSKNLYP